MFFLSSSGGLFDLAESKQEVAFRYAVERVNSNRKILSKSLLSAQMEKIPPQDSFHASKRGRDLLISFSEKKRNFSTFDFFRSGRSGFYL